MTRKQIIIHILHTLEELAFVVIMNDAQLQLLSHWKPVFMGSMIDDAMP